MSACESGHSWHACQLTGTGTAQVNLIDAEEKHRCFTLVVQGSNRCPYMQQHAFTHGQVMVGLRSASGPIVLVCLTPDVFTLTYACPFA